MALLSACGGGGGGGPISGPPPAPAPSPTPSPSPTPTPIATPVSTFDTAELRRSDGPSYHNAPTAWAQGASGAGVKIGIVDTGIDTDSPEFAGRIDSASADVAGNGSVEAVDDHGTNVAMIAAAARNNAGIVGIAYSATIVALRADRPGSCASEDDCAFSDRDIAAGIDRAVAAGATVVNLSLGGDSASTVLLDAVRRASAAGTVIVVSAGNEGDGSDPAIDPNQPNPFAAGVRSAGGANVIIVGSVNEQNQFSAFSNRAGGQAQYFLSALGERICCVYENGVLKTTTDASGTFVTLISGTSFSAPQVSGAVALLKQAFPNLTGAQMVDILLSSARDAGAAGTDATYGRGILDIAAAFAPQGATTLAGSTAVVKLGDDVAVGSSAMGDGMQGGLNAVVLDSYGRAYGYDIGQGMRAASVRPRLHGALASGSHQVGGDTGGVAMAFTLNQRPAGHSEWIAPLRLSREEAEGARVLAARVALAIDPQRKAAFGFREGADGLVAQLQGQARPAFLIATDARGDGGFARTSDVSLTYRQQFGRWGITASAEQGKAWLGNLRIEDGRHERVRERRGLHSFSIAADRTFGALDTALGVTWMHERETVLGAHFADALGAAGARTLFLDANAGWSPVPGWRLGAGLRQGWTRADQAGAIGAGSRFVSRAWSADLARHGVFGPSDSLGLRVSQPLRVAGGGLNLTLPVGYDYATLRPLYATRTMALTPSGREIDGELAWRGPLLGGDAAASLFYRADPGHIGGLPDDRGVAVKWSRRF
ncbi:S8 family serine peptidase [Altererythrobacter aerius]|uniref:S8 family serine peptidase n=2 Tax=Tsuneonella aeria TaxID=1837929 RepID=A0A6I4TB50_9SPHN|nr:S8 family serine peptidase [Tsuneonella aeria]